MSDDSVVRRATIRDVARLAEVGIKTVSRVMNGEPNVSAATAERVRRAARALSYEPDVAAGNLRRTDRRTQTIGLLVGSVTDPFFAQIHRAVEETATAHGYAAFTLSSDERADAEQQAIGAFLRRRVDGLILAPTGDDLATLAIEQRRGTPLVFVDRIAEGLRADAFVSDNAAAAAKAVNHLIRHGHRRIAGLFDRLEIWTASERAAGYRRALERAGLERDPALERVAILDEEDAQRAVTEMVRSPNPPTALFTGRATITLGAVRALQRLDKQDSIALVGFDDLDTADLLRPRLTVIAQRPAHIGRLAAERLLSLIGGPRPGPGAVVVPTDLIERGSGEIAPPG